MGGLVGVAQWVYRAWLCRSEIFCASCAIHDASTISARARAFAPALRSPLGATCVCAPARRCPTVGTGVGWLSPCTIPFRSGCGRCVVGRACVCGHALRHVSRSHAPPARCLAARLNARARARPRPPRAVRAAACELPSRQATLMRQRRSAQCAQVCARLAGQVRRRMRNAGGAASRGVSPRCPGPVPVTGGGYAT